MLIVAVITLTGRGTLLCFAALLLLAVRPRAGLQSHSEAESTNLTRAFRMAHLCLLLGLELTTLCILEDEVRQLVLRVARGLIAARDAAQLHLPLGRHNERLYSHTNASTKAQN